MCCNAYGPSTTPSPSRVTLHCCNYVCCAKCLQHWLLQPENVILQCLNCRATLLIAELAKILGAGGMRPVNAVLQERFFEQSKVAVSPQVADVTSILSVDFGPNFDSRAHHFKRSLEEKLETTKIQLQELQREINCFSKGMSILNKRNQGGSRLMAQPAERIHRLKTAVESVDKDDLFSVCFVQEIYEKELDAFEGFNPKLCPFKICTKPGCGGSLSPQQGMCLSCRQCICVECQQMFVGEDHVCKTEDIESLSLIASSSRPCPTCGIIITRRDGCPHMFCIKCATHFDYLTGNIIAGTPHHPQPEEVDLREIGGVEEVNVGLRVPLLSDFSRK